MKPSQKEINKQLKLQLEKEWDRYRKDLMRWLPPEVEDMRGDIEELLGRAFFCGGMAAADAFKAVLNEFTESPEPPEE